MAWASISRSYHPVPTTTAAPALPRAVLPVDDTLHAHLHVLAGVAPATPPAFGAPARFRLGHGDETETELAQRRAHATSLRVSTGGIGFGTWRGGRIE